MNPCTRRVFVHKAALGLQGLVASGFVTRCGGTAAPSHVFTPRMPVNPAIDNCRVVCGVNPSMIDSDPSSWTMEGQNGPVIAAQVGQTLDAVAIALSQKSDAESAWKALFRKPEAKPWAQVKAAIKVNCIGKNHPRIAVVNKICAELINLGVQPNSLFIYDGKHNAAPFYSAYIGKGLPAGIVVSDKSSSLGGVVDMAIPDTKNGSYKCTRAIAEGGIDILVNIAVNKSHDEALGKTTLTLKNHAGTFEPRHIHLGGGLDYILALNKSNAFWGGTPVRQQLCIVDSLWASAKGGPFVIPDKRLDRIVMGTFSGAVDYCTAKKVREPLMGVNHGPIGRFVTDFGYTEQEVASWHEVTV